MHNYYLYLVLKQRKFWCGVKQHMKIRVKSEDIDLHTLSVLKQHTCFYSEYFKLWNNETNPVQSTFLVLFLNAFNLAHGSVHRIQYRGKSVRRNAQVIAQCTKRVTTALFEQSNRIALTVTENMRMTTSCLTIFWLFSWAKKASVIIINESGFQEHLTKHSLEPGLDGDRSYVIIENDPESLYKIFRKD